MLAALLAATFQSGCVCLHDDAHQQMDSHRFVSKTDENAMRIIAYVLLYACKLTLQEPGEVALVFSFHSLVQLVRFAGDAQIVEHGRLEGRIGLLHALKILLHALVSLFRTLVVESYEGREHDVEEVLVHFSIVFQHHLLHLFGVVLLLEVIAANRSIHDAACVCLEESSYERGYSLITIDSLAHCLLNVLIKDDLIKMF